MALWSDWPNLASALLGTIADRVLAIDVADYVRMRAVCRAWRELPDPRAQRALDARFHPCQWIMLPDKAGTLRRRFLNLSTSESISFDLPQLLGQKVFGATTEGLFVLYNKQVPELRLLNPLTGQMTGLPLLTQFASSAIEGAGLAVDVVAVLVAAATAVAKPTDIIWTYLDLIDAAEFVEEGQEQNVYKAISLGGHVYYFSIHLVMRLEGEPDHPRLQIVAELPARRAWYLVVVYPVHIDGQLFLVEECIERRPRFFLYLVNLETRRLERLDHLGDHALFLGEYRTLVVSTKIFPSLLSGAIYLSHQLGIIRTIFCHFLDGTYGAVERLNSMSKEVIVTSLADCLCQYVSGQSPDEKRPPRPTTQANR